jgi:hypothetical protein
MLFFFAPNLNASIFEACLADTIIIDGKTVVVEKVIDPEEEIPDTDDPTPKDPTPLKKPHFYAGSELDFPGLNISSIKSKSGLEALDNFVYPLPGVKPNTSLHIYGGYQINKYVSVETGFGFTIQSMRSTLFSQSQLKDSLIGFQSPGRGQLQQIIIADFGIGGEQEIHDLELRKENFVWTYFSVPLRFTAFVPTNNRDVKWMFQGGAVYQFARTKSGQSGTSLLLVNSQGDYQFYSENELAIKSTWLSLYASAGYQWEMQHRQEAYFTLKAFVSPQILGPTGPDSPVDISRWNGGVTIGINKFF